MCLMPVAIARDLFHCAGSSSSHSLSGRIAVAASSGSSSSHSQLRSNSNTHPSSNCGTSSGRIETLCSQSKLCRDDFETTEASKTGRAQNSMTIYGENQRNMLLPDPSAPEHGKLNRINGLLKGSHGILRILPTGRGRCRELKFRGGRLWCSERAL